MNVTRSNNLLVCGLLVLVSQLSLVAGVSAQSNVVPTNPKLFNQNVAHPEGTQPPPYVVSADVVFSPTDSPGPGEVAQLGFNPSYVWTNADGSTYTRTFGNFGASNVPYSNTYGGFDLNFAPDPGYSAMTPVGCNLYTNGTNWQYPGPYVLGVTQVIVKMADGSALPSPCVVNMSNYYGPIASFTLAGTNASCYFGQGYYIKADSPYPQGMVSDSYNLYVTAPGCSTSSTPYNPGSQWAGQTYTVTLNHTGTPSPAPVASATPAANDTAAGVAAAAGPSDDTSILGFITNFWSKISSFVQSLFTIDPADLAALKTANDKFLSYGPLGAATSLYACFQTAFGSTNTSMYKDGSDPNYWTLSLNGSELANDTASVSAGPAGYNQFAAVQAAAPTTTIFNSMFPTSLNLFPYANYFLQGRRIALVGLWLLTAICLIKRFAPELRI